MKLFYLREALRRYDRVLLLDDSCYVTARCPNIFHACTEDRLGAVEDGGVVGQSVSPSEVINSGVLLVSQQQLPFFENFEAFCAQQAVCFDDQLLLNQAIDANVLDYQALDPRYNWVGSQISQRDFVDPRAYVYHLTGYLQHERRLELARKFAAMREPETIDNEL